MRALAAVLCAIAWISSSPAHAETDVVDELRALVVQHPEDRDLAWALIGELERSGQLAEAIDRLVLYANRWPLKIEVATLRLGRLLLRAGRAKDGERVLSGVVERQPGLAPAQLYHGLALRQLGRLDESEHALETAQNGDDDLRAEALLVRALNRFDQGRDGAAEALLRELVAFAPESDAASQAQLLLGGPAQPVQPDRRRLSVSALFGTESDSNVTLESSELAVPAATDESDMRFVWGAGASYRLLEGETSNLVVGYRYNESAHADLDEYDTQSHTAFASATARVGERALLRLDGLATDSHLDDDRYLRTVSVRPNAFYQVGRYAGTSRAYVEVERAGYHDPPFLASLDRDGTTYSAGMEHYMNVPDVPGAWGSIGASVSRTNTEGHTDILGFDGAFNRRRLETRWQLRFPFGPEAWKLDADTSAAYDWDHYPNRNVVDALFTIGQATRRQDRIAQASIGLVRKLTDYASLELRWRGTDSRSNVDVYTYRRHTFGVYLRAEVR